MKREIKLKSLLNQALREVEEEAEEVEAKDKYNLTPKRPKKERSVNDIC